MCTNPTLIYTAQTWTTSQKQLNKIYRTQLAVECSTTGIKLKNRIYLYLAQNKRLNRNKKYRMHN